MRTPFLPTLVLALVAALPASPAAARTWTREWAVGAHPAVRVSTNDARVRIHRGAAGVVSAAIEYTVDVWGFHTRVQAPEIELGRAGDVITVNARARSTAVFFGGVNQRFHVDVTVPADCDVQARSGDGSIQLEPVTGTIDLETGDGHLSVHGARGRIRLATGDGGIDADSLDGALDARTGDGHLKVAGRFDELTLRAGDGRIEAGVASGSQPRQPWSVETGDGAVTLRIPRDFRAVLDAHTQDGHLAVNLPIDGGAPGHRHELRGVLNGGTMPVRVRTGDGSLTLGLSE